MSARELLDELRARGIQCRREGDRLVITASEGQIDQQLAQRLREHKQDLLELLARMEANREYPLSPAQLSMWYVESGDTENALYNVPAAWRLRGPLDVEALERALTRLVERHEALRLVMKNATPWPVQCVAPPYAVGLEIEDVPRERLDARLEELAARKFDLERDQLFRAALFRLDEEEHVLLVVLHHIVADGHSLAVLKNDVIALYAEECGGAPAALPPLRGRFVEHIEEMNQWLESSDAGRQLEYWKRQLDGELPELDLPTDFPRAASGSGRGDVVRHRLDGEAFMRFREMARACGVSPFMALSALTATMCAAMAGQDEVILGSSYANRNRHDAEHLIGEYMNTLPLRIRIDREARFEELLREVRRVALEAMQNQAMPLPRIVEALSLHRDASRAPLFQAAIIHQPGVERRLYVGGLEMEPLPIRQRSAQLDITVWSRELEDGLAIDLEYSTDLFRRDTAERMLGMLARLIDAVSRQPAAIIGDLPYLSGEDYQRLEAWGTGARIARPAVTTDSLVLEQCARTPDAVAASCNGVGISYAGLQREAARVCARLRQEGVHEGDIVGVMMDRGTGMLAAMLGTWQAGAAYLPLDPEYPADRLRYMLEDSSARVVIADAVSRSLQQALLDGYGGRVVDHESLSVDQAVAAADLGQEPPAATTGSPTRSPDNSAYVIYTSGSTGRPKGVVVKHRGVVNFLVAMRDNFLAGKGERVLALTTLSFDIAVLELWMPLIAGCEVVIVPRDVARDGDALRALIDAVRPSLVQATPATWQMLINAGWKGHPGLTALCGGEALPPTLAAELLARADALWNMYGPTETTVWSTMQRVEQANGVTIGRPIANTVVRVVDSRGRMVPPGACGELWIGGEGVAAGYHGRPELNAERFVADRYDAGDSALMYRTGDRVRFNRQGELEYVGRIDFQIKLRGHRIEPGEIEAVLQQQPGVRQAVVGVHRRDGDARLVAWLLLDDDVRLSIDGLRNSLRAMLPAYMVPQHFVEIDTLPLTGSGKVDRARLPAPEAGPRNILPLATDTERRIAAVWQELLGVAEISADDNFFDLGGHSLLSMRVIARIDEVLGVRLRPRLLVLNTLVEIAAECDRQHALQKEQETVPAGAEMRNRGLWNVLVDSVLRRT